MAKTHTTVGLTDSTLSKLRRLRMRDKRKYNLSSMVERIVEQLYVTEFGGADPTLDELEREAAAKRVQCTPRPITVASNDAVRQSVKQMKERMDRGEVSTDTRSAHSQVVDGIDVWCNRPNTPVPWNQRQHIAYNKLVTELKRQAADSDTVDQLLRSKTLLQVVEYF